MERDELERQLRLLYVHHQHGEAAEFPHTDDDCAWCDKRMAQVMAAVDMYTEAQPPVVIQRQLLWSSQQVKTYLNLKSTDHARVTMSRWGIEAVYQSTGRGGQKKAYYPAKHVRAEAIERGRTPEQTT